MNYHTRSCGRHGTVIINIALPFKFVVSNTAPILHFSKRSEDPPCDKEHNAAPTLPNLVRWQQSFGSLWYNHIVKLPWWTKTLFLSGWNRQDHPHCVQSRHCLFPERLQNWVSWTGTRSTSEIWKVAHRLGALNCVLWSQIYDTSHIQRKLIWFNS